MKIAIKVPGTNPQRYVTLDPGDNQLYFDRTVVGPWETFDTSDPRFFVQLDAEEQPTNPVGFIPGPTPFDEPPNAHTSTDPTFLRAVIAYGIKVAGLRDATETDYAYWLSHWAEMVARGQQINVIDYAWKRLIGWQATGADKALAGPYA